jgi:hypothetical protein
LVSAVNGASAPVEAAADSGAVVSESSARQAEHRRREGESSGFAPELEKALRGDASVGGNRDAKRAHPADSPKTASDRENPLSPVDQKRRASSGRQTEAAPTEPLNPKPTQPSASSKPDGVQTGAGGGPAQNNVASRGGGRRDGFESSARGESSPKESVVSFAGPASNPTTDTLAGVDSTEAVKEGSAVKDWSAVKDGGAVKDGQTSSTSVTDQSPPTHDSRSLNRNIVAAKTSGGLTQPEAARSADRAPRQSAAAIAHEAHDPNSRKAETIETRPSGLDENAAHPDGEAQDKPATGTGGAVQVQGPWSSHPDPSAVLRSVDLSRPTPLLQRSNASSSQAAQGSVFANAPATPAQRTAVEHPDSAIPAAGIRANLRPPSAPGVHVAALSIEGDNGTQTRAMVRERNGAIDVKVVTPSEESARLVGAGLHELRRALDGAGLSLNRAEIGWHGQSDGGGNGRNGRYGEDDPAALSRGQKLEGKKVFIVEA